MVVCRYFLQGNCRFGNKCWNEHSAPQSDYRQSYNYASPAYREASVTPVRNRFSLINPSYFNSNQDSANNWTNPNESFNENKSPFSFTKTYNKTFQEKQPVRSSYEESDKIIQEDIRIWINGEQWPFSCYGQPQSFNCFPFFDDISPEELRWNAYQAESSGSFDDYVKNMKATLDNIKAQRETLLSASQSYILELIQNSQLAPNPTQQLGGNAPGFQPFLGGSQSSFSFNKPSSSSSFSFKLPQDNVPSFNSIPESKQPFSFASSLAAVKEVEPMQEMPFGSPGFASSPGFGLQQQFGQSASPFGQASKNLGTVVPPFQSSTLASVHSESDGAYSRLNELSETEVEQFKSEMFTLGKIPTNPPTYEMCF